MTPERPNESVSASSVTAPATGATDERETELATEEEPVTTGTLFLVTVMLAIIVGFWVTMYVRLLHS
jgi:hypothetical protein